MAEACRSLPREHSRRSRSESPAGPVIVHSLHLFWIGQLLSIFLLGPFLLWGDEFARWLSIFTEGVSFLAGLSKDALRVFATALACSAIPFGSRFFARCDRQRRARAPAACAGWL